MIGQLGQKKIAMLGLGTNNRALAEYFKKNAVEFDVLEWQTADELIGKLDSYDVVFRTPGLPYRSAAIAKAKSKGVEISSQTKLFFELCPSPIIGVTGTKGKGTTASLIARILAAAGKTVWLGGNIGRDPFEFLDRIKPSDWTVLELSSFQLQDLERSPHIAVVLNITPDHLNHHKSMSEYVNSKANILSYQGPSDLAVLHSGLPKSFQKLGLGRKIFLDPAAVAGFQTKLLGKHNRDNIAAAAKVGELAGVALDKILQAVVEFEPLPHRLNVLRTVRGVTYIDDGFSTNIDPVIAAIEAVESPVVLIIGGFDKGLDFTAVGKKILEKKQVKAVVIIGQMTDKILKAIEGFAGRILTGAKSMPQILAQANSVAVAGDTVLFSPGTSSFDMFKNESDRAEQFATEVNKLQ
ncbi:MAG: hypothetical protein A3J07_03040 [Candidatus Doudnabacteria bacterium RIFCSPLOWO2_02_FULL_49_13]|nr:MAG: hypothetical protein A3B77_01845 [Candidatus Doudnabacteria bacterium RIFCSPHIGHO2_02_FULL_49_24]OGE89449.1 MAG: hypothetical protein A2760_02430 [Candidatus Doudnabacteria bacterium RIFCSPHIGHO2_01_FULL_50_67]OGE97555.1 MAG: hypothetical protein A2990_02450 [Candidatus Doudnabacteria bacterium RIFCSPLOWO2_01_FULL_49_40]OGF03041.1 MAG: hypothetical protein A3J07_03040 [Candidatus Doudnabacteria bacterium RIFCSPLOWO2_02_FULL_49_13]OGF03692.1 MAG: hypothetical protein A3H14_01175 [Candida